MQFSPTRIPRLLAWIIVFGFVVGGASWGHALPLQGWDAAHLSASEGLPLHFVAVLDSEAQTPTSLHLLKVSDPVVPPVFARLVAPQFSPIERSLVPMSGAWLPGRGSLVGIVELRL